MNRPNPNYHGKARFLAIPSIYCPECLSKISMEANRAQREMRFAPCSCGYCIPPVPIDKFMVEIDSISFLPLRRYLTDPPGIV